MRFSKSTRSGLLGIVFLVLLIGVAMLIVDERASKSLDNVDITWDELDPKPVQNIPFKEMK
ncbi:MAG: hypothetical protein IMZ62_15935 [Chloroflexi bacterium]|nr:hypothetical protein [Chloroflexota bacterium]